MMRRLALPFATIGLVVAILAVIGTIVVRIAAPAPFLPTSYGFGPAVMVAFLVMGVTWTTVGAFLVVRRPDNAVGWFVVTAGVGYALSMLFVALTFAFADEGTVVGLRSAELAGWATVLCTQAGAMAFVIAFIFPTGRAQSPGWERFVRIVWLMLLAFSAIILFQPGGLHLVPTLRNPFGFGPDLRGDQQVSPIISLFAVIVLPAIALSLATRYRSASRVERQQLKWLIFALLLSTIGLGAVFFAAVVTRRPQEQIGLTLYAVALIGVPIAIGIAILRHGLYDIDRLISRTLAYGLVTGMLAIVFGSLVVLFGGLLTLVTKGLIPVDQGESIAVAASTLVVFTLFQPVRKRVQRSVDRRFDRARYDAEMVVGAFTARLRNDVDLAAVSREIADTTTFAVRPTSVSVWLRETGR